MSKRGITIIDVMRALGVPTHKSLTWPIGLRVMNRFVQRFHRQPVKRLRTKTCGECVHCFAVYPKSFRADIEMVICEFTNEVGAQGELFPNRGDRNQC